MGTGRTQMAIAKIVGAARRLTGPTRTQQTLASLRVRAERLDLRGARVLVTGSTRGIGRAVAEGLARAGARVAVHGRSGDPFPRPYDRFPWAEGIVFGQDLSEPGSGRLLVERVWERLGGLDVVVHSAAVHPPRVAAHRTRPEDIERALRVNVVAPLEIDSALAERLDVDQSARIIHLSSLAADASRSPARGTLAYTVSKTALERLTHCLADEASGLVVTTLRPAAVQTDMTRSLFSWDEHALMLPPESMVAPILWLATAPASDVHGRVFDQGELMARLAAEGSPGAWNLGDQK